jgi:antitoxin HicB
MLNYPITLTADSNKTLLVGFPDFPEANSVGADVEDALHNAAEALIVTLDIYFEQRRPIPLPSNPALGQHMVGLPALETAKALVWNEMFAQKLCNADLARLLNVPQPQVDRLFDINHPGKIELVEQAAKALGKSLSIALV